MSDTSQIQSPFDERASDKYALILFNVAARKVVYDAMAYFPEDDQRKINDAVTAGADLATRSLSLLRAAMLKRQSDWERVRRTLLTSEATYDDIHHAIDTVVSTGLAP